MNYFVTIKSIKIGFIATLVLFFSISISAIDVGVDEEESQIEVIESTQESEDGEDIGNRVSKMGYSELGCKLVYVN